MAPNWVSIHVKVIISQIKDIIVFFFLFLGAFPLSDVSLMTDEERELYLPAIKAFIKVLENDNIDQDEIDELIKEGEKLQVNFIKNPRLFKKN